jgi:hypothetical protein
MSAANLFGYQDSAQQQPAFSFPQSLTEKYRPH